MLNGITVYCDGKAQDLELDKRQAEKFLYYAGVASESDSVRPRPDPLPEEEVASRIRRSNTVEEGADNFKKYLSMIAELDVRQLALVIAFVDLIEYGESWMLETINDLLGEVLCSGPAKANERNPRDVLAEIAYNLFDWWDNIDTARSHAAQHPSLFAPPATLETPAAPSREGTTGDPRARKPRKKASHA
jgi:hypothetical protein